MAARRFTASTGVPLSLKTLVYNPFNNTLVGSGVVVGPARKPTLQAEKAELKLLGFEGVLGLIKTGDPRGQRGALKIKVHGVHAGGAELEQVALTGTLKKGGISVSSLTMDLAGGNAKLSGAVKYGKQRGGSWHLKGTVTRGERVKKVRLSGASLDKVLRTIKRLVTR